MPALHNMHTLFCLVVLTHIKSGLNMLFHYFLTTICIAIVASNFEQVQYGKSRRSDKR